MIKFLRNHDDDDDYDVDDYSSAFIHLLLFLYPSQSPGGSGANPRNSEHEVWNRLSMGHWSIVGQEAIKGDLT